MRRRVDLRLQLRRHSGVEARMVGYGLIAEVGKVCFSPVLRHVRHELGRLVEALPFQSASLMTQGFNGSTCDHMKGVGQHRRPGDGEGGETGSDEDQG